MVAEPPGRLEDPLPQGLGEPIRVVVGVGDRHRRYTELPGDTGEGHAVPARTHAFAFLQPTTHMVHYFNVKSISLKSMCGGASWM